eukprot:5301075-Amphidinium_carterae.1
MWVSVSAKDWGDCNSWCPLAAMLSFSTSHAFTPIFQPCGFVRRWCSSASMMCALAILSMQKRTAGITHQHLLSEWDAFAGHVTERCASLADVQRACGKEAWCRMLESLAQNSQDDNNNGACVAIFVQMWGIGRSFNACEPSLCRLLPVARASAPLNPAVTCQLA